MINGLDHQSCLFKIGIIRYGPAESLLGLSKILISTKLGPINRVKFDSPLFGPTIALMLVHIVTIINRNSFLYFKRYCYASRIFFSQNLIATDTNFKTMQEGFKSQSENRLMQRDLICLHRDIRIS